MTAGWWPVVWAFFIGTGLGGLAVVLIVATGWLSFFCKRGILCLATKVHDEPQQVHLSWAGPPDSTLAITWVTRSANNPDTIQFRPYGQEKWQEASGRSTAVPRSGLLPSPGRIHRVLLEGLAADTAYEYRVSSDRGAFRPWGEIRRTKTAPSRGPFTAAFIADTGQTGRIDGLADGVTEVLRSLHAERPLFILGGGDYAYANRDGRFADPNLAIDNWFRMMESVISEIPFVAQYGNHECRLSERLRLWKGRFANPPGPEGSDCYSFDIGGVHFTSLFADGENKLEANLLAWLDQDLGAARERGAEWLIVFQHESIYGMGSSHPARGEARDVLAPIFVRHKIDLHLSAHDQNLERTFPLLGDPNNPQVASQDMKSYAKGTGVIYAKVSPGGKRSEIGRGFSRLPEEKPAYVAVRDDTAHHYALISVSEEALEVRIQAIAPDGRPERTIDRFRIWRSQTAA
jgi:hypothetical protein